jgi:hypothetical protein
VAVGSRAEWGRWDVAIHRDFLWVGLRPDGLDRNDLEVRFGYATVRALPALGHIGPQGAGRNAVFGAAGSFVIHKAANDADIGFHGIQR